MLQIVFRRIAWSIPVVFVVTVVVFALIFLAPGDPAVAIAGGDDVDPAVIERVREQLGLNDPFYVQYWRLVSGLFVGDLGTSLISSEQVAATVFQRLPISLALAFGGLVVALLIAIPTGMIAAVKEGGRLDRLVTLFATLGISTPPFFVGLLLVLFVAIQLGWLPATGYVRPSDSLLLWLRTMALPSIALGLAPAAEISRHLRGAMRDVLRQDYVRTAIAKGHRPLMVIGKHGLKNAAVPVVTVIGLQLGSLISGSVVIESVFAIPGMGALLIRSVLLRDMPMIQGVMIVVVLLILVVNLLVDISYGALNPKVRSS